MSRILILGAGFGGLELGTALSEALGDAAEVTLIDKNDAFVFGYSKLDLLFRDAAPEAVRLPYAEFVKPGVRLLRETVTAIDPAAKRVTTDAGEHEADYLVIALGADYDLAATPGLAKVGTEFYSVAGAEALAPKDPRVLLRAGADRRLRRPLQVPAGAQRVRPDARRRAAPARRPRGLRDHLRDPPRLPGAALAGDLGGAARRVRDARDRADHRQTDREPRPGTERRDPRRRLRDPLRPLPRRAEAPRARAS